MRAELRSGWLGLVAALIPKLIVIIRLRARARATYEPHEATNNGRKRSVTVTTWADAQIDVRPDWPSCHPTDLPSW